MQVQTNAYYPATETTQGATTALSKIHDQVEVLANIMSAQDERLRLILERAFGGASGEAKSVPTPVPSGTVGRIDEQLDRLAKLQERVSESISRLEKLV